VHQLVEVRCNVSLKKLINKKSTGDDNISAKLVKENPANLVDPLIHLYSLHVSMTTGVIQLNELHLAKVIPVYNNKK